MTTQTWFSHSCKLMSIHFSAGIHVYRQVLAQQQTLARQNKVRKHRMNNLHWVAAERYDWLFCFFVMCTLIHVRRLSRTVQTVLFFWNVYAFLGRKRMVIDSPSASDAPTSCQDTRWATVHAHWTKAVFFLNRAVAVHFGTWQKEPLVCVYACTYTST